MHDWIRMWMNTANKRPVEITLRQYNTKYLSVIIYWHVEGLLNFFASIIWGYKFWKDALYLFQQSHRIHYYKQNHFCCCHTEMKIYFSKIFVSLNSNWVIIGDNSYINYYTSI